mmetsp:Transcript_16801/g.38813  ORF Transcript_16801/g.38813 Transcript_16801/m.38813 type:complete len:181 (+) Transcript_16801:104-646(+)|eukprot:CAMPEP_0197178608 /NCGR_PEP_ID=MMETSP1423-20130617/3838_1 /TAXON_ID=476441 /ORGANISM="Pseudo-nitzschia heimii, Strain UNC1101" /LENGTH=180 /DNA_ID=CAMNT_0042628383 /DNA_START=80 /DNA_END=622 /DNA_ORIENTATION=-
MSRLFPTTVRKALQLRTSSRTLSTVSTIFTANDAAELSGYKNIDFCIDEDATVLEAVKKFASHNIGCLVTRNGNGDLTGIISERDYISKVDLLDRSPDETQVKEIFTPSSKLVTANGDESVQTCMEKMLVADIRHLPLVHHGELKGMISIKDLVKTCIKEQDQTIKVLSDFALGKSAYSC